MRGIADQAREKIKTQIEEDFSIFPGRKEGAIGLQDTFVTGVVSRCIKALHGGEGDGGHRNAEASLLEQEFDICEAIRNVLEKVGFTSVEPSLVVNPDDLVDSIFSAVESQLRKGTTLKIVSSEEIGHSGEASAAG